MDRVQRTGATTKRANRSSAFQAYHDQLLQLVPTWEQRLAPDEVAFLVAVAARVFLRQRKRYSRWIDRGRRAA